MKIVKAHSSGEWKTHDSNGGQFVIYTQMSRAAGGEERWVASFSLESSEASEESSVIKIVNDIRKMSGALSFKESDLDHTIDRALLSNDGLSMDNKRERDILKKALIKALSDYFF